MTEWSVDDAIRFATALVQASHGELASLARGCSRQQGRGLVAITVRGPRPAVPELRQYQVGYRPLEEYRARTAPYTHGSVRDSADNIIRRVEAYDPSTQFIVVVVMGPQFLTVPFTLHLDSPVLLDDVDGVH
jgi:hypothetical protein